MEIVIAASKSAGTTAHAASIAHAPMIHTASPPPTVSHELMGWKMPPPKVPTPPQPIPYPSPNFPPMLIGFHQSAPSAHIVSAAIHTGFTPSVSFHPTMTFV